VGLLATSCIAFANFCSDGVRPVFVFENMSFTRFMNVVYESRLLKLLEATRT